MGFATIEEALEELRAGHLIMCIDDPDRENEGDLICAAQFATTANVNFRAVHAGISAEERGLTCRRCAAPTPSRRSSAAPAMCSPWWPGGAGCWPATATPRPRWICAATRGWPSAVCAVRSCGTTAP